MVADERRIRFRIGINLGDVIAEGDDIFGDGVNVAARLEALAEPGGICISGTVRDQIRDRLPYPFEDMGEQSVKNIARPVRVYALRPEAVAAPEVLAPRSHSSQWRRCSGAGHRRHAWWLGRRRTLRHDGQSPLVAPRLSIVVLPFANLSNDPEQQYFADGITEDLTTDLSRIADMFVISRNTAFTYQEQAGRHEADRPRAGRALCARRAASSGRASQVRVNAQLIDAETDAHLWAERFDRDTGDLFALQDEITSRIAVALNLELVGAEAARPTEHPDALDYILRGRAAYDEAAVA